MDTWTNVYAWDEITGSWMLVKECENEEQAARFISDNNMTRYQVVTTREVF